MSAGIDVRRVGYQEGKNFGFEVTREGDIVAVVTALLPSIALVKQYALPSISDTVGFYRLVGYRESVACQPVSQELSHTSFGDIVWWVNQLPDGIYYLCSHVASVYFSVASEHITRLYTQREAHAIVEKEGSSWLNESL